MTDSEPKPTEQMPPAAIPPTPPASEPVAVAEPPEPAPPAPEAAAETAPETAPVAPASGVHWGTGRRKSAVARVRILPGSGKFLINRREIETHFPQLRDRMDVAAPLELTGVRKHWDVIVNVRGGGLTGQAGAILLGLARALIKAYQQFELPLRNAGFLTRDAREVERKKYGRRKARRRFQFSKR